jgi:hypothetical protein
MKNRDRMLLWVTAYQLAACACFIGGKDLAGFFSLFAAVITVLIAIYDQIADAFLAWHQAMQERDRQTKCVTPRARIDVSLEEC